MYSSGSMSTLAMKKPRVVEWVCVLGGMVLVARFGREEARRAVGHGDRVLTVHADAAVVQ